MKRLPAILAVLLGLSAPAMAQSLSLDQAIDEPTLIRLSVSDAPKLDRSAVLDRIAKMTVMMRDPFGRESTLDIEKSDKGLQGRLPSSCGGVMYGSVVVGVVPDNRGGGSLLQYHPKAILDDPFLPNHFLGKSVPLEVVVGGEPGKAKFQVLAAGEPLAKTQVSVRSPGSSTTTTVATDDRGFTPPFEPSGRYAVFFVRTESKSGTFDNRPFDRVEHVASLTADIVADVRDNIRPISEPLTKLLADKAFRPAKTLVHPLLGRPAPDFELTDVTDSKWKLRESLRTGPVVLVFYYGYYCNHCVAQLFAMNNDLALFKELKATVVAVSADSSDMTRQRTRKYGPFDFDVLSDPNYAVAEKFGTFNRGKTKDADFPLHGTFLIDRQGIVRWASVGEQPFTDNRSLIHHLNSLNHYCPVEV